jgi:hypothetical protein
VELFLARLTGQFTRTPRTEEAPIRFTDQKTRSTDRIDSLTFALTKPFGLIAVREVITTENDTVAEFLIF